MSKTTQIIKITEEPKVDFYISSAEDSYMFLCVGQYNLYIKEMKKDK